jgi:ankyrin repeat protein
MSVAFHYPLQTPMHSACIKGDLQVAEMLIDHVRLK